MVPIFGPKTTITEWKLIKISSPYLSALMVRVVISSVGFVSDGCLHHWLLKQLSFRQSSTNLRAILLFIQLWGKKKKDFKTWVNSWTRWYLWTVFKRVLNFNFDRSPQENSGGLNQNVFDLRGWSTWEWIEVKCRYQATFVLVHLKLKKRKLWLEPLVTINALFYLKNR